MRERCCSRQNHTKPRAIKPDAIKFYRRTYFFGAGTDAAKEAETKLTPSRKPLTPQNAERSRMQSR